MMISEKSRSVVHLLTRARALIAGVQERFDNPRPVKIFIIYFFSAMVIVVPITASQLLRIDVPSLGRLKGYWFELNWGVNHQVAIPITLLCCAWVLRDIRVLVDRVAASGMIVDRRFDPIDGATIRDDWKRSKVSPLWFVTIVTLAFVMSWGEWFVGSLRPIWSGLPFEPQAYEGWTAGALLKPEVPKLANVCLSFVAFTAQGFIITVFVYTLGSVLAFSNWLFSYSDAEQTKLIPNLATEDTRLGFDMFERLVHRVMYMALAFVVSLFCIRVQSLYNGSPSKANTVYQFVLDDVVKGFFTGVMALFRGNAPELFTVGDATNYSTIIAIAAVISLITVVLLLPNLVLSVLAHQSHDEVEPFCAIDAGQWPRSVSRGLETAKLNDKLTHMDYWPLRYPRPLELLAYVVFSGFCFFFYKFAFVLMGIFVFKLVHKAYETLSAKTGAEPRSTGELPDRTGTASPADKTG